MSIEFPAIRYQQGGREVYAAATRVGDVLQLIPPREDPDVISDANRRLFPAHGREFGEYIWATDDWLTGPLMVGVDEASFKPGRGGGQYGMLVVDDDAEVHLFDGQHRRYGLQDVLEREAALADTLAQSGMQAEADAKAKRIVELTEAVIPTIFYVEEDVEALRQMYSDISRVRPPDPITTARFDTRDPFNVAARALSEANPLLEERVDLERNTLSAKSPKLITLNQLAALLQILWYGAPRRSKAQEPDAREITDRAQAFFSDITAAFPSLKAIADGTDSVELARERADLTVSVTMLKVLAGAWRDLRIVQQQSSRDVVEYLSTLPATAEPGSLWVEAGIAPKAKAPIGRTQVAQTQLRLVERYEEQAA